MLGAAVVGRSPVGLDESEATRASRSCWLVVRDPVPLALATECDADVGSLDSCGVDPETSGMFGREGPGSADRCAELLDGRLRFPKLCGFAPTPLFAFVALPAILDECGIVAVDESLLD